MMTVDPPLVQPSFGLIAFMHGVASGNGGYNPAKSQLFRRARMNSKVEKAGNGFRVEGILEGLRPSLQFPEVSTSQNPFSESESTYSPISKYIFGCWDCDLFLFSEMYLIPPLSGHVYSPSEGSNRLARRPCLELLCTNMLSEMANNGPSTLIWVEITTWNKQRRNMVFSSARTFTFYNHFTFFGRQLYGRRQRENKMSACLHLLSSGYMCPGERLRAVQTAASKTFENLIWIFLAVKRRH